jgi:hypothetical protein
MLRFAKLLVALLFSMMFYSGVAHAQASRTWVSGVGDDVNPCSRTAPCKTFAGAISKTAAGGEINCLDPGGFGAVTITKSLTIDCTGTLGSILNASTSGVTVNDGSSATPGTARVILRGLTINGGPPTPSPGLNGVRYISGASLTLEDVFIQNQLTGSPNGFGIHFRPNNGQGARLVVNNTTIINSGTGSTGGGIFIETGTGSQAQVMLNNVRISLNGSSTGISLNTAGAGPGIRAVLMNGHVSNATVGISATNAAGAGTSSIVVSDTAIVNNTTGVLVNGTTAAARVSDSVITGNTTGLSAAGGGLLRSNGGNLLDGNTANGAFTDTLPKV